MQSLTLELSKEGPSISDGPQNTPLSPGERYIRLLCKDKIDILTLWKIFIASRVLSTHIDWADASSTELRKEKEVNRRLHVCDFLEMSTLLNLSQSTNQPAFFESSQILPENWSLRGMEWTGHGGSFIGLDLRSWTDGRDERVNR